MPVSTLCSSGVPGWGGVNLEQTNHQQCVRAKLLVTCARRFFFYSMKCNRVFRMQNGKPPLSIESGGWDALESGKNVRQRDSGRGPSMCKGTVGRRGLLALRHESVFCMANSGWALCGREAARGGRVGGFGSYTMCFEFIMHVVKKHGRTMSSRQAGHSSTNGCAPVLVPIPSSYTPPLEASRKYFQAAAGDRGRLRCSANREIWLDQVCRKIPPRHSRKLRTSRLGTWGSGHQSCMKLCGPELGGPTVVRGRDG